MRRKIIFFVVVATIAMLATVFLGPVMNAASNSNPTSEMYAKASLQPSVYSNLNSNSGSNISDILSLDFAKWAIELGMTASQTSNLTQHEITNLFNSFIADSPSDKVLLDELMSKEIAKYQKENSAIGSTLVRSLENGSFNQSHTLIRSQTYGNITIDTYSISSGGGISTAVVSDTMTPNVGWNDGVWEMATINYLYADIYIPILNVWEVIKYGEQDNINTIYAGDDAQTYKNAFVANDNEVSTILDWIGLGSAVGTYIGSSYLATLLTDVGKAFAKAAASLVVIALAAFVITWNEMKDTFNTGLNTLFDDTYANHNDLCDKYLWLDTPLTYYYPNTPLTVASSVKFGGATNDAGNMYYFFNSIYIPIGSIFIAANYSGIAHKITGYLSNGQWGYVAALDQVPATITLSSNAAQIYPQGLVTVTVTAYDSNGNPYACGVPVKVTDTTTNTVKASGITNSNGVFSKVITFNTVETHTLIATGYFGLISSNTVKVDVVSPPSGGGCILNGTLVSVTKGNSIPVQDLKVGENILSYDPLTNSLFQNKVISINVTVASSILDLNHGLLYVSGMKDQPIYTLLPNGTAEWIMVGSLTALDKVLDPLNGTWIQINSIQALSGNFTVFDIVGQKMFNQSGHMRFTYLANEILLDAKTLP